jgi:hypothetical protein
MSGQLEYRGIAYSIPNNDNGEWRLTIYRKKIRNPLALVASPKHVYRTRDDAVNAAKRVIDALLDKNQIGTQPTIALKKVLFDTYDGFADKRIKNLENSDAFIVDDRGEGDYDARGALFLWFCQIGLIVKDRDSVVLTLRGGIPDSARVAKWLMDMGAQNTAYATQITINRGHESALLDLASAIRAITARGARYNVKAYKHVCPRPTQSLAKLANVLRDAWSD